MLVISASVVFTVVILNLHFRAPETHIMSPLVGLYFGCRVASLAVRNCYPWVSKVVFSNVPVYQIKNESVSVAKYLIGMASLDIDDVAPRSHFC